MRSPLRILVLTSSTGGGHDARADAFAEWCFLLFRHGVDVRIEQMLENSSVVNRWGVNAYNWIQKKAPFLHTAFYSFVEGLSLINTSRVSFGSHYYSKVLAEYRPHLVLSFHDCLNRGYFQQARRLLGASVRCATYCGEFSGGWGYSRNWVEPTADLYISRTSTAQDYAIKLGVRPEKARVRGSLMRPRASLEAYPPEALPSLRQELSGLRPDLFTVFLATGSNGANNHLALLNELLRHTGRCQAILICGKNREIHNTLLRWRTEHPEFPCHIEGYADNVHLLMQASDAIVTRGGTTTCAKALHFKCPIIFNGIGGVMPQERLTIKYFRNGAGSPLIASSSDFGNVIDEWLLRPESYQAYRKRFQDLGYAEDPSLLIRELVSLAAEAAGVAMPSPVVF